MNRLCLVTYTRCGEEFTDELRKIAEAFYYKYNHDFKVIICCEQKFELTDTPYDVFFFEKAGTKYRRLISVMEVDNSEYYISIDNDITGCIQSLLLFIKEIIENEYEVGWGKIRAIKQRGIIANMVAIDKLLSHNIIRPLLWKSGKGISIPGQIFCIKGDAFRGKLIDLDTFLDDLALGLYVNIHHSKKYLTDMILGEEKPNITFKGLLRQRARWAEGYYTIISSKKINAISRERVLIHGFCYHMAWIINWITIVGTWLLSPILALAYIVFISILIVNPDIKLVQYAIVYQFVFPIFHIQWGAILVSNIIKGKGNEKQH
jgi:hypothetical protein rflaF_17929